MMTKRLIEIKEGEQATLMVRSGHHVTLIFGQMLMDVFERDGMLFTRQGRIEDDGSETQLVDDDNAETQPFDEEFITPQDTQEVIHFAGGTFQQVNEKHASRLEMSDMALELENVKEELGFECGGTQLDIFSGDTQLDGYISGSETESDVDDELYDSGGGDTQIEKDDGMYTRSGLYIPKYLR